MKLAAFASFSHAGVKIKSFQMPLTLDFPQKTTILLGSKQTAETHPGSVIFIFKRQYQDLKF